MILEMTLKQICSQKKGHLLECGSIESVDRSDTHHTLVKYSFDDVNQANIATNYVFDEKIF